MYKSTAQHIIMYTHYKCGLEGYPKYRKRNKDDGVEEFIIKKKENILL